MNYEIQAQRAEVQTDKDLALRDDVEGPIVPVVSYLASLPPRLCHV